ncbi:MAG: hypothetical protein CVT79_13760 [Alphaproteobacteria bacterium HGW-Alphaproteobacteria-18]|nr:MAG: hypothetical protein CVT79_13760 [Alphaproteobacteria bacterium HGW-Alphaproteobacteria-18]
MRLTRFAHQGRPAVWGVNVEWWTLSDLLEMIPLGATRLEEEEVQFAVNTLDLLPGSSFSTMRAVNHAVEGEWRWANDREALIAEQKQVEAKAAAKRAAQEERYKTRLKGLTWEQLLAETPFERWVSSPPFPDAEFTQKARVVIHDTCIVLRELGQRPRKSDVRKVLKGCVEWFNNADELAGGVIETEEREDIYGVLEEIAHVARQKSLVDEIDAWRTW